MWVISQQTASINQFWKRKAGQSGFEPGSACSPATYLTIWPNFPLVKAACGQARHTQTAFSPPLKSNATHHPKSTPDTHQTTRQNQFNTQHNKQHNRISSTPDTANNTIESVQGYYLLSVLRRLDSDLLQLLLLCDLSRLCIESSFQVILQ